MAYSHPFYKTAQWLALRAYVLRGEPLCRYCMQAGRVQPATVVDHIRPHDGDRGLFYDTSNVQPLCASCHSGPKRKAEVRGWESRIGHDGWPLDSRHPANKRRPWPPMPQ